MGYEFDNNVPIYIQLVEKLKLEIISGKIKSGDRLPSVREFAFTMKVNPNTMQKALVELEELGLIYTERTNGKFVTENQNLIDQYREEYVNELSKKYFKNLESIGYSIKDAVEKLKSLRGDK